MFMSVALIIEGTNKTTNDVKLIFNHFGVLFFNVSGEFCHRIAIDKGNNNIMIIYYINRCNNTKLDELIASFPHKNNLTFKSYPTIN